MRFKKTEPRVVEQHDYHSSTVCDFCGARKDERRGDEWPNDKSQNNASEVEIQAKIGDVWPEDDCRTLEVFDCCPPCWESLIKPALVMLLRPGHSMRKSKAFGPYDDTKFYKDDPEP